MGIFCDFDFSLIFCGRLGDGSDLPIAIADDPDIVDLYLQGLVVALQSPILLRHQLDGLLVPIHYLVMFLYSLCLLGGESSYLLLELGGVAEGLMEKVVLLLLRQLKDYGLFLLQLV